jgi:hypothetical protein
MTDGKIRRRLRISLRATMLVIVLLGVWLGWQVNTAREQRQAVAAVQKYGRGSTTTTSSSTAS